MQTPDFMKPELAPNGHSPPLLSSTSGCIPAPGMALRASLSSSFPIVVPYIAVSTSARTHLHVLPKRVTFTTRLYRRKVNLDHNF